MTDTTSTPTTTERKPQLSLILSLSSRPLTVENVPEDAGKPRDEQRIRIDFFPVSLFIQRQDIPALVNALILA